jgi:hypothetical protein
VEHGGIVIDHATGWLFGERNEPKKVYKFSPRRRLHTQNINSTHSQTVGMGFDSFLFVPHRVGFVLSLDLFTLLSILISQTYFFYDAIRISIPYQFT